MSAPAVSVVVFSSHARRLRLRWLLNALEAQNLDFERFEVIVVHDYTGEAAEQFDTHPSRGRIGCGRCESSRAPDDPRASATWVEGG